MSATASQAGSQTVAGHWQTRPIRDLLAAFPEARPILASHGLDTCCGGAHPLVEACAHHGLDPSRVLDEIRQVLAITPPRNRPKETAQAAPARFSPRFVIASLVLALTFGATSGAISLLRIAAGAEVPLSHRQMHGASQILGFAALFLMGIAFHALPRMLGLPAPSKTVLASTFWLLVSGVVLRNVGQPLAFFDVGRILTFASGPLAAASGTVFAIWVLAGLLQSVGGDGSAPLPGSLHTRMSRLRRRTTAVFRDPMAAFVGLGTLFLFPALAYFVVQGAWIAGRRDPGLPTSLSEPFNVLALQGFLLAFLFGFASRMVPAFLGLGSGRRSLLLSVFALQTISVPLLAGSHLEALSLEGAALLRDAGLLGLGIGALLYLGALRLPFGRAPRPMPRVAGAPEVGIRLAFSFLLVWALLLIGSVLTGRFTNLPAHNPWWADAARHTFTVGFLTMMIVSISFRVVPVFTGKTLWSPGLARLTYGLLAAATLLRLLQLPAAYRPGFYLVASWMGIPGVAALVLYTINMMKTVKTERPKPAGEPSRGLALPIHPAR